MTIKELNFPIIYKEDIAIGYGGNQEWFLDKWQRRAGCGSTSGANLAAYYASNHPQMANIYDGNILKFNKDEYLHIMQEMYRYMRPGPFGFPFIKKFAKKFLLYCKNLGMSMDANILDKYKTIEESFNFVKENINAGRPIALLILIHRAKEIRDNTWHWITVTGYIEYSDNMGASQIIVSNYGKREMISTEILFEMHPKNKVRMASFRMLSNK